MFLAYIAKQPFFFAFTACMSLNLISPSVAEANEGTRAAPVAATISLHIVATNVEGVNVIVSGKKRGVTPTEIKLPRSNKAVTMSFRKDGYETKELRVTPHRTRTIKIKLKKIPPPPKKKDPRENLPF